MLWKIPQEIKIYEALGTIADKRIEINKNTAKVYSSSRNKYYEIIYDKNNNAIMSNDNASYFNQTLGYPSIAYLMKIKELNFNGEYSNALKGIMWKDLNQKYNNNFEKTKNHIDTLLKEKGINLDKFQTHIQEVLNQIKSKKLKLLGEKQTPPKGY